MADTWEVGDGVEYNGRPATVVVVQDEPGKQIGIKFEDGIYERYTTFSGSEVVGKIPAHDLDGLLDEPLGWWVTAEELSEQSDGS